MSVPAATPPAMPAGLTAAFPFTALHAPPDTVSVRGVDEPTHTLESPEIVPAAGNGLTVTVLVIVAVPHALKTEYLMVSTPAATPATTPSETVAFPLLLVQIPPAAGSVNLIVEPIQTLEGPDIIPGYGFT